jgi:hypothetical protein
MSMQAQAVATASAPEPKSGIVWIASFPKSGNTWTRMFLHNLAKIQAGEDQEQDINEMDRFSTWELDKRHYARFLGYLPDDQHRKEIAAVRDKVHELLANQVEGVLFIKTHNAMVLDRGYSTINFAVTAGAVYLVRSPLDVAISYWHHSGTSLDSVIQEMGTNGVETKSTEKGIYEVLGSWSQHVHSWTRLPHRALYVMRYEDMLADPAKAFGALARHLLLNPTPAELEKAVERSSFEKLQAQEKEKGFRERPDRATQNFFREGRVGQWKEVLTQAQIDRIVNDHGEQMQRFGYLPLT